MVVFEITLEGFKKYINNVRCVWFRDLGNEMRIYAGRVYVKVDVSDPKEKQKILAWLKELEKTKDVIEVKDVTSEEQVFI